ncbi:hypothetical protein J4E89_010717 [Alternaria sp. Ai002NY15]|nr:hypothetical protein J4E89_010717 [Alternaria sp. Ai002NY15]
MRLLRLDSKGLKWVLHDFPREVPFYAILSHTWGHDDDEVKFEDIQHGQRGKDDTSKPGYEKLRFCQERVEKDGLIYFWIDTCCINKSDSRELQQSLASMFYWYQRAARCYVHLSDVSSDNFTGESGFVGKGAFSKSKWFKRGWTLQELIAPSSVRFYTKQGGFLGDKNELADTISIVTRIPISALKGSELSRFSKKERMSWTQGRITTVPEDAAYCLIGIFDVELPMLYADGNYERRKKKAQRMLKKAIAEAENDADHERLHDVAQIGGASWGDLIALEEKDLKRLDLDLEQYQQWLLFEFPKLQKECEGLDWSDGLPHLSKYTRERMKKLLEKYGVHYEDMSDIEASMQTWEEPRVRYLDESATAQTRVQGLVQNQWVWAKLELQEDVFMGITALRTFEDLMIWRGIWKK